MISCRWLIFSSTLLSCIGLISTIQDTALADKTEQKCPQPALSRLIRHKVAPSETLNTIAQRYNLIPATLMGMNPALRNGKVKAGSEILVPPYNGIRIEVKDGQTWRQLAAAYKIRPEVLYEVNGCQKSPKIVFVPGVNWSPNRPDNSIPAPTAPLGGYPLRQTATVALGYGWKVAPGTAKVFFHTGLDLLAPVGTQVQSIGAGTVAFAGNQGSYGNLVVINHTGGMQSRYAHLQSLSVRVGQTVKKGDAIGKVGKTGKPTSSEPHLHFEIRSNSSLGWVAEDPNSYLKP